MAKHVPAKYFYDAAGLQLFERITDFAEYYPICCEIRILRRYMVTSRKPIPPGAALVEFAGSSKKARILLRSVAKPSLMCQSISAAK
jgi:uncharacterized SAM-dependent methyltransferase